MDTRTRSRIAGLLAVVLAGPCGFHDPGAAARRVFRAATLLIQVAAPARPPAATITTGVRG